MKLSQLIHELQVLQKKFNEGQAWFAPVGMQDKTKEEHLQDLRDVYDNGFKPAMIHIKNVTPLEPIDPEVTVYDAEYGVSRPLNLIQLDTLHWKEDNQWYDEDYKHNKKLAVKDPDIVLILGAK